MNLIVLSIADGTVFFVGMALVLVAEILLVRLRRRTARSAVSILALIGMILVVISATPMPVWVYAAWMITAIAGLVLFNRTTIPRKFKLIGCAMFAVLSIGLFMAEAIYRRMPKLMIPADTTVYVLGDSLSAGIGMEQRCWPTVLSELTSLKVINLAQPGAGIANAIIQAKEITESDSLVIVEIGGNDLLRGEGVETFRSQLEILISSLRSNQHQILIVELPLFPFQNAFGSAQRGIAAKYDAALLPKQCLARVLGMRGGTLDDLHLSQKGHNAMAKIIARLIERK